MNVLRDRSLRKAIEGLIVQKGSHNLSEPQSNYNILLISRHCYLMKDIFQINIWQAHTFSATVCLSSGSSNGSPQQQNQQPDLRIRRQHSSDSVSSITSATSHSSVGSNMDADSKNKKKNKKNWVRYCKFKSYTSEDAWFHCAIRQAASTHGGLFFLSFHVCVGVTFLGISPFRLPSLGKRWLNYIYTLHRFSPVEYQVMI